MNIGFIGLGIMGKPMSKNLIKGGYKLLVYDKNGKVSTELAECGAQLKENISEVVKASDVIITMLPDSPQVEEVVLGQGGILEVIKSGQIIIDMSSISPVTSKKVAELVFEKGAYMLDAPVSGGEIGAIEAKLAIMVGGSKEIFETVKPILEKMGSTITWVGEAGSGNVVKLANQMIVAINIAAVSEAMTFCNKAGIESSVVYDAIKGGLASSRVMDNKINNIMNNEFKPGFRVNLHIKDLYNALSMGRDINGQMMMTSQVLEMFKVLLDKGFGDEDHSALFRYYNEIL